MKSKKDNSADSSVKPSKVTKTVNISKERLDPGKNSMHISAILPKNQVDLLERVCAKIPSKPLSLSKVIAVLLEDSLRELGLLAEQDCRNLCWAAEIKMAVIKYREYISKNYVDYAEYRKKIDDEMKAKLGKLAGTIEVVENWDDDLDA